MNYGIYKNARNASWQCLLDCGISELPIRPTQIARHYGIVCKKMSSEKLKGHSGEIKTVFGKLYILYNADDTPERQRFSVMHELGHCLLGHFDNCNHEIISKDKEDAAERFAADMLMPACILWGLNIHTAEDIADLCNVSMQTARIRAKRMEVLYHRNMFLSHPLERRVFGQFQEFIHQQHKKNKKMNIEDEGLEKVFKLIRAASDALKNAPFDTNIEFRCPFCGNIAKASKSSYNGHERASCNHCKISFRE